MHPLLLIFTGLIVGMMNALGGGGTFIAFPILLFFGIPPISANASATIATWPGTFSTVLAYRKDLTIPTQTLVLFGLLAFIGGSIGAFLLLRLSNAAFALFVPYLLLAATCLFTFRTPLLKTVQKLRSLTSKQPRATQMLLCLLLFLATIYGGFFGAGLGILILAILTMMGRNNIHHINALRAYIGLSANTVALFIFGFSGLVAWPQALAMGLGTVIGGALGGHYFRQLPQKWGFRLIALVAWSITLYCFIKR